MRPIGQKRARGGDTGANKGSKNTYFHYQVKEMKTNLNITRLLLILIIIILLPGCLSQGSWPQSVPPGDIIFQSNMREPYELNIIQDDGTNHQILNLPENFVIPHWSANGKFLLGLSNPYGQFPYEGIGYPSYWNISKGEFHVCGKNQPYFFDIQEYKINNDQFEVILASADYISIYDLKNCQQTKKVVDYSVPQGDYRIEGISYFPKTNLLIYGRSTVPFENREYKLISKNLTTGEEEELADGIHPNWSPDGRYVAFMQYDGLYILSLESKTTSLLVESIYYDPKEYGFDAYTPYPRWSPDGKWLVYHQCSEEICSFESTFIKIVRIDDGYIEELFKGGKFPSWMP